jgi:hypothetical protein
MSNRKALMTQWCILAVLLARPAFASGHVRFDNKRIAEVFRYAVNRSPSFEALIETLNLTDRVVYVEEGRCPHPIEHSCLALMPTPNAKNILVRIDPRQPINVVVAQLAHELYHVAEVSKEPAVVDAASLRELYSRIGDRGCFAESDDCWETRAACAFEALVTRELVR